MGRKNAVIISTKAREITYKLATEGLIQDKDVTQVYLTILQEMREGGTYQLLESGDTIKAKTVIRNKGGKKIGIQG